jgi:hypothetical protein
VTPQQAAAHEAIRNALATYNNTGDRGLVGEMMAVFANDAVLDTTTEEIAGRGAIEAYFNAVVQNHVIGGPDKRPSRHHLTTSRIELLGEDAARAWTYFLLIRDGVTVQTGIYVDQFAREAGNWLITRRRVKLEYNADAA